ncbi:hypothetical protein BDV93DRAFT_479290 [Ceratobasidium sp. AG-I]|nr:hypothetical protein BDV93DRAFT_479290 [Ceratobasidium sp. AG-I]
MSTKPALNDTIEEILPTHLSGVYIVGPSSSGKTTLCKALAARIHLSPSRHISEVARSVMKSTSYTRDHVEKLDMQRAILRAQSAAEKNARSRYTTNGKTTTQSSVSPFLLCDRSAIDPLVYASLSATDFTGAEILAESPELQELLPIYQQALFVLLHPVDEWIEDDGVRSLADPVKYPSAYKEYLERFGIGYQELNDGLKGLEARVDQVLSWAAIGR